LRERLDDKLPYDPKQTQTMEASPAELRQVPETSASQQLNGIAVVKPITREPAISPEADDPQTLNLRG